MSKSTNNSIHLSNQVGAFVRAGRFLEALPLVSQLCEMARLQDHVNDQDQTLSAKLACLGLTLRELGRYTEAESACLEALSISAVHGKETPLYASRLNELGRLYEAMGKYHQAEGLFHSARNIRLHALGAIHPDYAESVHDSARLDHVLGQPAAEAGIRNALAIRTATLGEQHFDVAECLLTLALIHGERDGLGDADQNVQKAIDIIATTAGSKHPAFARSQHLKAWIALRGGHLNPGIAPDDNRFWQSRTGRRAPHLGRTLSRHGPVIPRRVALSPGN